MSTNIDRICGLLVRLGVVQFTITGDHIRCQCPIHGGDNPTSLAINYRNGLYFCHSNCSPEERSGGLVKLICLSMGCSSEEAAILLAGIELDPSSISKPQKAPIVPLSQQEIDNFEQKTTHCYGYRGYEPKTIEEFNIRKGVDYPYSDRVWVPLNDREGWTIGYKGRATSADMGSKYIFLPRGVPKSQLLFNLHRIKESCWIVVCEGEFDCINLHRNGYPCVATMSSKASATQLELLSGFDRVVVFYDNDEAGHAGADELENQLKNIVGIVFPPPFKDAGDLTQEELYDIIGRYVDGTG
ncbi:toprim domain-containing protein [Patescibacteria group bacterium]|nr:toprim domain-containing protein [Patescibacteria group bacterium]